MPGFDRFYIIIASIITTIMFVTLGTGCAQQRVTLTDPLVYARSTDELHVGWVQQTANGNAVVSVDGKIRSKPYDEIGFIYFSPDNQRVAYSVKNAGKWKVMIDEVPGPDFDEISIIDVAFSPDSKRLAYAARNENKWYAILDGKAIPDNGHDSIRNMTFSPDNRHFSYIASNNDKQAFVLDGTIGPLFEKVSKPVWSPDGSSIAYIATDKDNKFMVHNGKEGPGYDDITTPVFSFSGRHFAYSAMKGGKSLVVTDGKEGPSYDMGKLIDTIKFAPSDERLGYIAKKADTDNWVVVIDGKEVSAYAYIAGPSLIFNPDGKGYSYAAAARNSPMMIVDEKGEGQGFDQIIEPVYSPDGRIAYGAMRENQLYLVSDGPAVPEPEFKDIFNLSFSPDGKHLMFKAIGKESQFIVLDGHASPAYDRVYKPAFTTNGVEYLAEREKDGFLWRGLIPYAQENKDIKSARDTKIVETKLGWLPTKESMTHECALCEKQKEALEEEQN